MITSSLGEPGNEVHTSRKILPRFYIRCVFHLHGETGCSSEKSNGTDFSNGNFSEKEEYLQRYSFFLVFTEMIGKSCIICFVPLVPCSLSRFLLTKQANMASLLMLAFEYSHLSSLPAGLAFRFLPRSTPNQPGAMRGGCIRRLC